MYCLGRPERDGLGKVLEKVNEIKDLMAQSVAKKIGTVVFNKVIDTASHHVMNAIHQAGHKSNKDESSPMDLDDNDGTDADNSAGFDTSWQREFHHYAKHGIANDIGNHGGNVEPHGLHRREHQRIIDLLVRNLARSGSKRLGRNMVQGYGHYRYRRRYNRGLRRRRTGFRQRGRFARSSRKLEKVMRNTHELKFLDIDSDLAEGNIAFDTNIGISALNVVAQGVGNQQRIGRKIFVERLLINGVFTGAAAQVVVRMIVVRYRHTNGATPTATELFEGGVATAGQILAYKDLIDGRNARVIWDHVWRFSAATDNDGGVFRKSFKIGKPTMFDGATGAIGDVDDGLLGMFVFSDATTASNASPALTFKARLRYRDA